MPGAGQLNALIDILKGFQDVGVGETTTDYKLIHHRVPAQQEDVSGGQTRRGHQIEATVKTVFVIPWIEGIDPHWRVRLLDGKDTGPTFEIVSVIDRTGMRRWLELHCGDVR